MIQTMQKKSGPREESGALKERSKWVANVWGCHVGATPSVKMRLHNVDYASEPSEDRAQIQFRLVPSLNHGRHPTKRSSNPSTTRPGYGVTFSRADSTVVHTIPQAIRWASRQYWLFGQAELLLEEVRYIDYAFSQSSGTL